MLRDGPGNQPPYLTVGQITAHLRAVLLQDDILQDVWVRGEASSVTLSRGGHLFFSLKEGDALIKAVVWSPLSRRLHAQLKDGQEVLAHGRVDLYAPQGVYQLYVTEILPVGAGLAYLEFERVRAQLAAEGLFDEDRKRSLPRFPRRVGVVTSAYGAARRDIENVLAQRWPSVEMVLAGAMVQGDSAPASLIAGLELVAEAGVDVIIIGRGGGDMEALSCFNDEGLARAIAAMPVPVVAGIGHETDFTIADFVADLRAPTPSAAAMAVVPDRLDVAATVATMEKRLHEAAVDGLDRGRRDVLQQTRLLMRSSPRYVVASGLQAVDDGASRLVRAAERTVPSLAAQLAPVSTRLGQAGLRLVSDRRALLGALAARLGPLDPEETLRRGYAVVHRGDLEGPVVADASMLKEGDAIAIRLSRGQAAARVTETVPDPKKEE